MKNIFFISILFFVVNCAKQNPVHEPENKVLTENELETSKNRAKDLNNLERAQIQDWINSQSVKYYPMGLNYWVNIDNLDKKTRKQNGQIVSYQFDIYDFDGTKVYEKPIKNEGVVFGRFEELDAVEDALRYLDKGETAELLVPSGLAYGTYGDNKKISNDVPLIIKVKVL